MRYDVSVTEANAYCPRCGYDVRGDIATWREACPLEGTCAECGLTYHWREVLGQGAPPPSWSIEQGDSWLSMPTLFIRMLLMMARPWRFWSQVQMHHSVRFGRIILMYFMLVVGALAVARATGAPVFAQYSGLFDSVQLSILLGRITLYAPLFTPIFMMIAVLMPVCFITVPASRRQARVQWNHIVRIALYSFMPFVLLLLFDVGRWIVFVGFGRGPWGFWLWRIHNIFSIIVIPLFLVAWWACAIHFYLKMRHGLGFALGAFFISGLVFTLIMVATVIMSDV